MKLVSRSDFAAVITQLMRQMPKGPWGLDTETTGLEWKDRLFSIQIATEDEQYYFNFNSCKDAEGGRFAPENTLTRGHLATMAETIFSRKDVLWAIQNAIFDLVMLKKDGITVAGQIHCTRAAGRTVYNEYMKYDLNSQMQREFNENKNDLVKQYIAQRHHLPQDVQKANTSLKNRIKTRQARLEKDPSNILLAQEIHALEQQIVLRPKALYDMIEIPGKHTRVQVPYYYLVPERVIVPYGCDDADQVRRLAASQLEALQKRPIWPIERQLAQISTDMQCIGLKVDKAYVQKAFAHELNHKEKVEKQFCELTGAKKFVDGVKCLVPAFEKFGLSYPKTEKGNPSFKSEVLELISHPVADLILQIRHHAKNAGTYYSSFLYLADKDSVLHPTLNPDTTRTGRFSGSNPNMQNIPKEEEEGLTHYMRKCFVPPPGYVLFNPDYDQQEFKMMLDYAGETELITRVNAGEDLHEATAKLVGCTRKQAKTLNYGLLYGMGAAKLARALGVDLDVAKKLKKDYFKALPRVQEFIRTCMNVIHDQGYLRSWAGRIFFYPDTDFAYKGANSVIQGGCADVLKIAMISIEKFLRPHKTKMVLQVHDELMFLLHKDEFHLAPELVKIMESVYKPMNGLPLTCSASWSPTSWGHPDKIKGYPSKEMLDNLRKVG